MNRSPYIAGLVFFMLLVVGQILLFRNVVLFGLAFNFAYIGFLLMLPLNMKPFTLLSIAFGVGLLCDTFYDTAGMHTSACLTLAFLRPTVLKLLAPPGGYDEEVEELPHLFKGLWQVYYLIFMSVIHHSVLFSIDALGMGLSFGFFGKVLLSALMTTATLLAIFNFPKSTSRK